LGNALQWKLKQTNPRRYNARSRRRRRMRRRIGRRRRRGRGFKVDVFHVDLWG
jgi:hypothetical protein